MTSALVHGLTHAPGGRARGTTWTNNDSEKSGGCGGAESLDPFLIASHCSATIRPLGESLDPYKARLSCLQEDGREPSGQPREDRTEKLRSRSASHHLTSKSLRSTDAGTCRSARLRRHLVRCCVESSGDQCVPVAAQTTGTAALLFLLSNHETDAHGPGVTASINRHSCFLCFSTLLTVWLYNQRLLRALGGAETPTGAREGGGGFGGHGPVCGTNSVKRRPLLIILHVVVQQLSGWGSVCLCDDGPRQGSKRRRLALCRLRPILGVAVEPMQHDPSLGGRVLHCPPSTSGVAMGRKWPLPPILRQAQLAGMARSCTVARRLPLVAVDGSCHGGGEGRGQRAEEARLAPVTSHRCEVGPRKPVCTGSRGEQACRVVMCWCCNMLQLQLRRRRRSRATYSWKAKQSCWLRGLTTRAAFIPRQSTNRSAGRYAAFHHILPLQTCSRVERHRDVFTSHKNAWACFDVVEASQPLPTSSVED